jgi:uracil phosphoribosyltransferase
MACFVVDHALVRVRVAALRDRETGIEPFRKAVKELGTLVGYEAVRDLACVECTVETPLAATRGHELARPVVVVPILRAGLGMAEAMLSLLPEARVGHIGMFRNEQTLAPEDYFLRMPPKLNESDLLLVDPMLATGNSACAAIARLKSLGAVSVRLVCLVGCPEGVSRVEQRHPDVSIFLAAIDEGLNERGYIVPGLGDAGDRYFGT